MTFGWILTGTTETTVNNIRIKVNNATHSSGYPSITSAGLMQVTFDCLSCDGTNALAVAANSAATAGAVYTAFIVATLIG